MKNYILILLLMVIVASCSGFLENSDLPGLQAYPEALAGGGYISTDQYNEISPFIFRNNAGNTYLFFSSDRNGSYDIFYSRMNADGLFEAPTALAHPVNYPDWDEVFPSVAYAWGDMALALLRIQGAVTNLLMYTLEETNFYTNSAYDYDVQSNVNATGLGHYYDRNAYEGEFLIVNGNNSPQVWGYDGSLYYQDTVTLSSRPVSMSLVKVETNSGGRAIGLILMGGEDKKLSTEAQLYTNNNLVMDIVYLYTHYNSAHNDITPFIDYKDGFKIYFASDRYGKGNYDLYRYNEKTYQNLPGVESFHSWAPLPQVQINSPVNNSTTFGTSIYVTADPVFTSPFPVYEMYCNIDGQPYQKMSQATSWEYNFTSLSAGTHTIKVYGVDTFRRSSPVKSIHVTLTN